MRTGKTVIMKLIIASVAAVFCVAASAFSSFALASAGPQMVATVTASAAISGRVVDSRQDTPIAGVKVTAFPQGSTVAEATATTDSQGRFTLSGLRGGDYRLLFEHIGYPKSLAGGIGVKSHEHLVLISPFAIQADARTGQARLVDPCGSLVQPGQVADVYVICSGH